MSSNARVSGGILSSGETCHEVVAPSVCSVLVGSNGFISKFGVVSLIIEELRVRVKLAVNCRLEGWSGRTPLGTPAPGGGWVCRGTGLVVRIESDIETPSDV